MPDTTGALSAACPFCRGHAREIPRARLTQGVADGPFRLFDCTACDLVFVHPMPARQILEDFYGPDYHGEAERGRFWGPLEAVSLWFRRHRIPVRRYFKAPGRVLDIGCGRAEFLRSLAAIGWEAHGVELNALTARRARQHLGDRIFAGDLHDARFPDGFFDLVSLYHVIEHLTDPQATIDEIHRVLKPGGLLLLSTPNGGSWGTRWFREKAFGFGILHNCFYLRPTHLHRLLGGRFDTLDESYFSLEQDPFSYVQTLLNVVDRNDNFLFRCLYRNGAAAHERGRLLKTVGLGVFALVPGLLLAVVSSWFKGGYTMTFVLRKR